MHRKWKPSKLKTGMATMATAGLILTGCAGGDGESQNSGDGEPTDQLATEDNAQTESDENGSESDIEQLVADAQSEGRLVWYGSPAENVVQALSDAFADEYDLEVEYVRLVSGDLQQRFSSESEAGASEADAIMLSHSDFFQTALDEGWLVDIAEAGVPNIEEYPSEFVEYGAAISAIEPRGLAYNTDLVDEGEVPTSWTDLTDPRWKDEILLIDPSSGSGHTMGWAKFREEYGDEFLQGVGDNGARIYPGMIPMHEALAAGEGSVGVTSLLSVVSAQQEAGAPLEFFLPDFAPGLEHSVAISADAQNPNAARLFAHWLLFGAGHDINTDPALGRASPVTQEGLPENYVRPDPADLDQRDEIMELLNAG